MASIFSYDPEPPKVYSPWAALHAELENDNRTKDIEWGSMMQSPLSKLDFATQKLEAEPQEGPTEYKLHLLLRPRRIITQSSTSQKTTGPQLSAASAAAFSSALEDGAGFSMPMSGSAPSQQSRQLRLQSLTTQLFWRLQQSSPFHSSSATRVDLVLPQLPEATAVLSAPARPHRLLPGLEESRGALYEIGVADDGTLVGLIRDEMEESLNNLRAMAASLGCDVQVLRMYVVGDCEWQEPVRAAKGYATEARTDSLWVAEAFVKPTLESNAGFHLLGPEKESAAAVSIQGDIRPLQSHSEQLRVSLLGATTSGKSSLLGTLSTSVLDDRRGRSRLNLLKHRHELASGVTSSIANELIGYDADGLNGDLGTSQYPPDIVNYATGNISCWTDVHSRVETGRLVFFSDSAGHPRYRRTMLRGLIGWAPHWALLCIAGHNRDDSEGGLDQDFASIQDVSQSQLGLCLSLQIPLVIVITKLDRASSVGLKQILTGVLTQVKAAGRLPLPLFKGVSIGSQAREIDPHTISSVDWDLVQKSLEDRRIDNIFRAVPIVLTSAANGTGIGQLHSLLCQLPIPCNVDIDSVTSHSPFLHTPTIPLFHTEEVFSFLATASVESSDSTGGDKSCVLSGHVQRGDISMGDVLILGPFGADDPADRNSGDHTYVTPPSRSKADRELSVSQERPSPRGSPRHSANNLPAIDHEWRWVRVISLRNLRLPVRKLLEGQVGTVGIAHLPHPAKISRGDGDQLADQPSPGIFTLTGTPKARKGMILSGSAGSIELPSYCGFVAWFEDEALLRLGLGSHVTVFWGSVRAIARIERVTTRLNSEKSGNDALELDVFHLDDRNLHKSEYDVQTSPGRRGTEVHVQFLVMREWIEEGSQVLLIPGSERGLGNLEFYVGRIMAGIR
ncbi:MAG: hypothetical protein M1814_000892 [Vezdaea aestivalis]|nr:MAG: hypothetical protein M1814_000892 [Vezdaea aestivalis]